MPHRCSGCGLEIEGGTAACRALFEEMCGRDFGNALYFRMHRKMVDTYSVQHPDDYCASVKSLAAHLCGLAWFMEGEGRRTSAVAPEALHRWLSGRTDLKKPEPPAFRGTLTIGDIDRDADPVKHEHEINRWAAAAWEAYAPLHELARDWLHQALSRSARPRRG